MESPAHQAAARLVERSDPAGVWESASVGGNLAGPMVLLIDGWKGGGVSCRPVPPHKIPLFGWVKAGYAGWAAKLGAFPRQAKHACTLLNDVERKHADEPPERQLKNAMERGRSAPLSGDHGSNTNSNIILRGTYNTH